MPITMYLEIKQNRVIKKKYIDVKFCSLLMCVWGGGARGVFKGRFTNVYRLCVSEAHHTRDS